MTEKLLLENSVINQEDSKTKQVEQQPIVKKIKKSSKKYCYCKCKQKKKYEVESPEESSYEVDGWEQEDQFNNKMKSRLEQKSLIDLKCFAWNLELLINHAKQQLAHLEGTLCTQIAQQ